jgi:hypothetical protein
MVMQDMQKNADTPTAKDENGDEPQGQEAAASRD